jgi:hypothetical protein
MEIKNEDEWKSFHLKGNNARKQHKLKNNNNT